MMRASGPPAARIKATTRDLSTRALESGWRKGGPIKGARFRPRAIRQRGTPRELPSRLRCYLTHENNSLAKQPWTSWQAPVSLCNGRPRYFPFREAATVAVTGVCSGSIPLELEDRRREEEGGREIEKFLSRPYACCSPFRKRNQMIAVMWLPRSPSLSLSLSFSRGIDITFRLLAQLSPAA